MPGGQSPTLRRRRLGAALRQLREQAEISREQVGEKLDCSASKIGRIENGDVGLNRRDLNDMLDMYGLDDPDQRQALLDLAREGKRRDGWWRKYSDLPNRYLRLIELEAVATSFRWFEPMVVPGLLQTEDYARAVIRATKPAVGEDEVERRARVRMTRQELLTRDDAPEFWTILDEAALRRVMGGPAVMRGQLEHLVQVAKLPNVTVQVLPFSHGGHEATTGAFALLRFPDKDPDIVYVEGFAGDIYLEDEADVRRCSLVFDHLAAAALSPQKSIALIREAARGME